MTSIDAGLPGLVSHYARTTPDALAVTDGETTLTYAGLEAAARGFARVLRERGVRPGDAVGVLLPHSVPTVVTQLAVWCAGGHYVPLDPDYPPPRIATMLETAGAVLTVGSKDLTEAAGIPGDRALLPPAGSEQAGDATPFAEYDPDAVAYVMFTSGSTGQPKGVAVTHRGIAGLAHRPEYVTITPRDRVLFHSPVTFDASAFEVWGALANGAAVAVSTADRLSPTGLARDAERLGATVTVLTTALFHHLAARRSPLFGVLRGVLAGGEALSAQHARSVLRAHPWLELVNGYGPTEATTFATAHLVPNVWGFVDALPMTGVGKVDRRALAERPVDGEGTDSPPAPAASLSPLQQVVADLWSQALGFPVDDPAADFIALGGHSLLALCVVEDLREDLGVEMSLADFFATPTVAAQAAHVEQALLRLHEGPGTPDEAPSPSVVEDPR
ncbi:non-ribosomal peptide synthetase [Streptomyces rimosus]